MFPRPSRYFKTPGPKSRELLLLCSAIAILVTQQLAISNLGRDGGEALLRRAIFFVTTPVLVGLALAFRRYLGAWFIAFGIVLNFVPIVAHGGLMPVSYTIVRDSGEFPEITEAEIGRQLHNGKDILLWREDIHFYELSDRYTVDAPLYGVNIYSLGDFVLFAGALMVIVQATARTIVPGREEPSVSTADRASP